MDQYFRGKEYKKIHTIALDQPEECLTLTMLSVSFEMRLLTREKLSQRLIQNESRVRLKDRRESSQLGKHSFESLHNFTWASYHSEDILLQHWLRFTNEVD